MSHLLRLRAAICWTTFWRTRSPVGGCAPRDFAIHEHEILHSNLNASAAYHPRITASMDARDVTEHLLQRAHWGAGRSSGPGGQHRDKASTRAELIVDGGMATL
jgi:hypothetical protein